jgi:hypothetical protein
MQEVRRGLIGGLGGLDVGGEERYYHQLAG